MNNDNNAKLTTIRLELEVNYGIDTTLKAFNNSYYFFFHWQLNKFSCLPKADLVSQDTATLSKSIYDQIREEI